MISLTWVLLTTSVLLKEGEGEYFLNDNEVRCGQRASRMSSRIVNGTKATPGRWPWQVMILQRITHWSWFQQICGGTLIKKQWILTAAHCNDGFPASDFRVALGGISLNRHESTKKTVVVASLHCHEMYNWNTNENDICLFKLVSEVSYNDYIRPACLPTPLTNVDVGETCVVIGWGETIGTGDRNILRQAEVGVIDHEVCAMWYASQFMSVPENHLCAGHEEGLVDTCQGDSGGPLTCIETMNNKASYVIRGITSFGYDCALPQRPGVYTSVVKYLDWIRDTLQNNSGPDVCFSTESLCADGSLITENGTILRSPIQSTDSWLYPANTDFSWRILAPIGAMISLEFLCFFNIEGYERNGCDDYVMVNSETIKNPKPLCGTQIPKSVVVENNFATITFHSNSGNESSGFVVNIMFLHQLEDIRQSETVSNYLQSTRDWTTDNTAISPTNNKDLQSTTFATHTVNTTTVSNSITSLEYTDAFTIELDAKSENFSARDSVSTSHTQNSTTTSGAFSADKHMSFMMAAVSWILCRSCHLYFEI